jgi:hypothetical protein
MTDLLKQCAFGSPTLFSKVITEDERVSLKSIAMLLLNSGVLQPNPVGPNRFFKSFYTTDAMPNEIRWLYHRVVQTLNAESPVIDPMLGAVVSVIKPTGYIHSHTDRYEDNKPEYFGNKNVRFNVMVERGKDVSYEPHIIDQPFKVGKRDAWCFNASDFPHYTPPLKGRNFRIVYQFGFMVGN